MNTSKDATSLTWNTFRESMRGELTERYKTIKREEPVAEDVAVDQWTLMREAIRGKGYSREQIAEVYASIKNGTYTTTDQDAIARANEKIIAREKAKAAARAPSPAPALAPAPPTITSFCNMLALLGVSEGDAKYMYKAYLRML